MDFGVFAMEERTTPPLEALKKALDGLVKEQLVKTKYGRPNIYRSVMNKIEPILLELVLDFTGYNQSRTAKILGLSRSTLRAKLDQHFGNKYFPQVTEIEYEEID